MKTGFVWMVALAAILCLGVGLVLGQNANTAGVKGVVRDTDGKPIAGVRMSLLNVSANAAAARPATTTTDAKGEYTFANVNPGTYTVTAELLGFQTARYSKIALANRQTLQLDFKLYDGAVSSPLELTLNPPKEEPKQAANTLPPLPPLPSEQQRGTRGGQADTDGRARAAAPPAASAQPTPAPGAPRGNTNNQNNAGNLGGVLGGAVGAGPRGAAPAGGAPGGGGRGGGNGQAGGGGGGGARSGAGGPAARGGPSGGLNSTINSGVATVVPSIVDRTDRVVIVYSLPNRTSNETYERIADNPFISASQEPLATLAIDVDTASYSNVRRFLSQGQLPPRDAVRIEELINYFSYDYPFGASDHPITANIEAAAAPWDPNHRLVRVGIKAKDVLVGTKRSNLVFLVDVSGSMSSAERLPLLKNGMNMLVEKLTENDTLSIVTYSGMSGISLNPTNGTHKDDIRRVVDSLRAEGSTNGGAGIQTAYDLATKNFIKGGVNRVILMTDGDFNVGVTSQNELISMIEDKARSGVFLSVFGVGTGNVRDNTMEKLADKGHGNYAYIDSISEARKVMVDQMASTFINVAKDVKIQVEFNPDLVLGYRLIGYENRLLAAADFNNDRKDGGDMGSGQTVTALFEVVQRGKEINPIGGDPLRFQPVVERTPAPAVKPDSPVKKELLNLKIRYKDTEGSASKLIEFPLLDRGQPFSSASSEFRFAASVAAFGMILRDSPFKGSSNWDLVNSIATGSRGSDRDGYREEFVRLAERARILWRPGPVILGDPIRR
jgi:Ca-activated chloride channel family protein